MTKSIIFFYKRTFDYFFFFFSKLLQINLNIKHDLGKSYVTYSKFSSLIYNKKNIFKKLCARYCKLYYNDSLVEDFTISLDAYSEKFSLTIIKFLLSRTK